MKMLNRSITLLQQEGIYGLYQGFRRYFTHRTLSKLWLAYNIIKEILFDTNIVLLNGIKIDTGSSVISNPIKRRIQSKKYESAETNLIRTYLDDCATIDLGAGIGYTTCLIDACIGESVMVIGVEANENLLSSIQQTKHLNDADFEVVHAAYATTEDTVNFNVNKNFWSSSIYNRGNKDIDTSVPAYSITDLINKFKLPTPIQIVVDIEGSEQELIQNELDVLSKECELLIIEFHTFIEPDLSYYLSELRGAGFDVVKREGETFVFRNTEI